MNENSFKAFFAKMDEFERLKCEPSFVIAKNFSRFQDQNLMYSFSKTFSQSLSNLKATVSWGYCKK